MTSRIALISCVKSKRSSASPAGELYTSPLFRGLKALAQESCERWYILSAMHGVLAPAQVVAPYELTLNTMRKRERLEWASRVQSQLVELLPAGASVTLLAGARYREGVEPFLRNHGFHVTVPLLGLSLGQQLSWLKRHRERDRVG
jgi:cytoplasmic iron level regulating protein YaaA (DUF328/UPF0246 family)